MPSALSGWPAGDVFADRRTLVQDVSGGDLTVRYRPGAGGAILPIGGTVINGDLLSRNVSVDIRGGSGGNDRYVAYAIGQSIAAAATMCWPPTASSTAVSQVAVPPVIPDGMELRAVAVAMGANEDATFSAMFLYVGPVPTVTEVIA